MKDTPSNKRSRPLVRKALECKGETDLSRESRIVLLAVTGMSPAILTETVWALAHPQRPGEEPVIPHEVIVITTVRGKADLERDLLTPKPDLKGRTVWQSLRLAILGASATQDPRITLSPVRVISRPAPASGCNDLLEDIRSPEENNAAAEFILDEIRRITTNDDTRLIASLAGGRKTMGALLTSAISLLGRPQDRLTHVLVNAPFDNPHLSPQFFFPPAQPVEHSLPLADGSKRVVSSAEARLDLADVPFAPLSNLFRNQLGRLPGGFMSLIRLVTQLVDKTAQPISIEMTEEITKILINGTPVKITGRDLPFFLFMLDNSKRGQRPFGTHKEVEEPFGLFLKKWIPQHPEIDLDSGSDQWSKNSPGSDDFRKRLDSLRNRLKQARLGEIARRLFPTRGSVGFPPEILDRKAPCAGAGEPKRSTEDMNPGPALMSADVPEDV